MSHLTKDSCSSIRKDRAFYLMKLEVVTIQLISGPSKLPIRNLKQIFKTTPVLSAFTGSELVQNLVLNLRADRKEAIHIAFQLFQHGYFYPVEQSVSTFKDDSTLYRMQSEHRWPSQCNNPNNLDYTTYLEKKMLQKLKLSEHEQEAYERFRVIYSKNWDNLNKKAREQINSEEANSKEDRNIQQAEERAFWHLHRPAPGEPLVMEASIQKRNLNAPDMTDFQVIRDLELKINIYKRSYRRNCVKISHSAEIILEYMEKLKIHDPFLRKNVHNPWINDFKSIPPVNPNRFQLWSSSFDLLLRDKLGRELFMQFLASEVSSENLQFCQEVTQYKMLPASKLKERAPIIFFNYCGTTAKSEINIDGKTFRAVKERMLNPDRYTFDPAQNYIYDLMRKDPYSRFLKSKYFSGANKKFSMDKKTRRASRITPLPLNAETMHLHNHHNSFEFSNSRNSMESNLHKTTSLDNLVDSLIDPGKSTRISEPYTSFGADVCRTKASERSSKLDRMHRNTSGGNLVHSTHSEIPQMDEVDENTHSKLTIKTNSFQSQYPVNNSNSKVGGSFEELALTQPVSPNIRNLPRPKSSITQLKQEEVLMKKMSA